MLLIVGIVPFDGQFYEMSFNLGLFLNLLYNPIKYTLCMQKVLPKTLRVQGRNSQNFLGKFVRFFVTLRCFYNANIHEK